MPDVYSQLYIHIQYTPARGTRTSPSPTYPGPLRWGGGRGGEGRVGEGWGGSVTGRGVGHLGGEGGHRKDEGQSSS